MEPSQYRSSHTAHENDLDAVYNALADSTRRELMELLVAQELSITTLTKHFPISRVAVTKHLNVLQQAGLVHERKIGREHRYRLNPEPLREAHNWLAHYEQFWSEKLTNLKAYIEEDSQS
ncbi:MAG: winged helix-turn-helix transcriptional regulator [Chloroflexi bacterium]|nr:winged helix-turn-helix transcriptional regulator [Chloroflexota bacterium]